MQRRIIKSTLYALAIACGLIALNFIYTRYLWPSDLEKYAPTLLELHAEMEDMTVLYLGDCSDQTISGNDSSDLAISDLIQQQFPKWEVAGISHNGYHAGMYRLLVENLDERARGLQTLVVTLNLRTFSPYSIWNDYQNAFNQSQVLMNPRPPLLNRALLNMGWYDRSTKAESQERLQEALESEELHFPYPFEYATTAAWNEGVSKGSYRTADGQWDQQRIEAACYSIKDFGLHVTDQHALIAELDQIAAIAQQRGIRLVFALMPENMELIDALVGPDLVFLVDSNRNYLTHRYREMGVTVLDQLELLTSDEFIEDNPNEHYTIEGRRKIAHRIARDLATEYPWESSFDVTPEQKPAVSSGFSGEGPFWTNLNALSEERAHSGKRSAKLNKVNPFSPTFTSELPANLADQPLQVEAQFFSYAEQSHESFKLVIELEYADGNTSWHGFPLEQQGEIMLNTWQRQYISFPVNAETGVSVIKVYAFNDAPTSLFVDDLEVDIKVVSTGL